MGAKMAEFAGYNMAISYTGINEEHHAVRNNAGLFDVSHMGEFILKGENALDLIQRVTTNDASKLTAGKAQYTCMPNEQGGIIDDLIIYCIEENKVASLVPEGRGMLVAFARPDVAPRLVDADPQLILDAMIADQKIAAGDFHDQDLKPRQSPR